MKISMYHSDLISGFAFVCFNGEAYLLTIYFYYHRNILHPALRSCPGTEEGHSKYIFFWSWSKAELSTGMEVPQQFGLWWLYQVSASPSLPPRGGWTRPVRQREKESWTLVERLVGSWWVGGSFNMFDVGSNWKLWRYSAPSTVRGARLPGVSPCENQF